MISSSVFDLQRSIQRSQKRANPFGANPLGTDVRRETVAWETLVSDWKSDETKEQHEATVRRRREAVGGCFVRESVVSYEDGHCERGRYVSAPGETYHDFEAR